MSKPKITKEQALSIDTLLSALGGDKVEVIRCSNRDELQDIEPDSICRYLYAPDTVIIEALGMSEDERLNYHHKRSQPHDENGNPFSSEYEEEAFQIGMRTALRIIGRQTPGVITWEE